MVNIIFLLLYFCYCYFVIVIVMVIVIICCCCTCCFTYKMGYLAVKRSGLWLWSIHHWRRVTVEPPLQQLPQRFFYTMAVKLLMSDKRTVTPSSTALSCLITYFCGPKVQPHTALQHSLNIVHWLQSMSLFPKKDCLSLTKSKSLFAMPYCQWNYLQSRLQVRESCCWSL